MPLYCKKGYGKSLCEYLERAPGRKIGIFGIGGVGHMAIQFGKQKN